MVRLVYCIVLFVIADTVSALVNNTQIEERNALEDAETRRYNKKKKKERSTSSSNDADSIESGDESLAMSSDPESEEDSDKKKKIKGRPKSTEERRGWRKWHRKCHPCPDDMWMKWRDPRIKWICGAYQRAKRSFKSLCMMHYRNCQDGTMFTKIHDHRCENSSSISPHGDHFFYEYRVVMTDDDTDSKTDSDTPSEENSSY